LGMPITGGLLKQLRAIREDRGIHNNTDLIRNLIKEAYNKIRTIEEVKPSTIEKLDSLMRSKKYASRSDLIDEAVGSFLTQPKKPQ